MRFTPEPYQQLGIKHLLENERAALFAGLGLGKTSMTLGAINELFLSGAMTGALIVAPLRVAQLTWPDEVAKWSDFSWMRVANLRTEAGMQDLLARRAHLYTINYESLPRFVEQYLHGRRGVLPFDIVVFDELTKAKNPDSKRINLLRQYLHKVPRRWGLTGTPNPNSLLELFAQVRLLDDGERFGKSYAQFRDTYFQKPNEYAYNYVPADDGVPDRIYARIADLALVLRSSDYLGIADTILEDIEVPLPKEGRALYDELAEELYALLKDGSEVLAPNAAVLANKLLQVTGGAVYIEEDTGIDEAPRKRPVIIHDAKIKALKSLLKRVGEPTLVACNYRHERERILAAIPGSVSFTGCKDERVLLRQWNLGQVSCLVADPRSIGHGLNMQDGGRAVVWFSQTYSRELYDQLNARLARKGQKGVPLLFRLISPGTIDDAVAETLRVRLEGQSALLQALVNFQRLFGKT